MKLIYLSSTRWTAHPQTGASVTAVGVLRFECVLCTTSNGLPGKFGQQWMAWDSAWIWRIWSIWHPLIQSQSGKCLERLLPLWKTCSELNTLPNSWNRNETSPQPSKKHKFLSPTVEEAWSSTVSQGRLQEQRHPQSAQATPCSACWNKNFGCSHRTGRFVVWL